MKKLLWSILVLISLLVFIGLTSCLDTGDQERPGLQIDSELILHKFWRVTFFEDNGENLTHEFSDVYLQFLPNFSLSVTKGCQEYRGEWVISSDSTFLVVRMASSTPAPLDQLSDEWVITNLTDDQLHIIEQDDKGDEEFVFEVAPLRAVNCQECGEFGATVTDSVWSVGWLQSPSNNFTDAFKGTYLKFQPNGLVTWFTQDEKLAGDWAVTDGCHKLTLEWHGDPIYQIGELAKVWLIDGFDQHTITMHSEEDPDNQMRLIKGKFPVCFDETQNFINTQWFIGEFSVNGDDVSEQYVGTGFTLLANNQLVTEVLVGPAVLGTWVLVGECDQLLVDLQLGSLQELSKKWTIVKLEDQSIYLVYEGSGNRMEIKLIKGTPKPSEECSYLIDVLQDGMWNIYRFEDISDDSNDLESYTLQFQPDGNLVAEKEKDNYTGSWSMVRGCQQLTMDFGETVPLADLNLNWQVVQFKKDEIKLVYEKNNQKKELILTK